MGVNVEKARHQSMRIADAAAVDQRRRWLANLTPEHRRVHEGPYPFLCRECMNRSVKEASEALARVLSPTMSVRRVGCADDRNLSR